MVGAVNKVPITLIGLVVEPAMSFQGYAGLAVCKLGDGDGGAVLYWCCICLPLALSQLFLLRNLQMCVVQPFIGSILPPQLPNE
jgi:hypothetical protein